MLNYMYISCGGVVILGVSTHTKQDLTVEDH
jgi:hypothetical protein